MEEKEGFRQEEASSAAEKITAVNAVPAGEPAAGAEEARGSEPAAAEPQPLVRATLTLDGAFYKRLYRKMTITACIGCALGAAVLVLWLVASTLKGEGGGIFSEIFADDLYLFLSVILLVACAVIIFTLVKTGRDAGANVRENTYLFYEREFTIETSQRGKQMGISRLSYADLRKIKDQKQFFFLTVPAVGLVVVDKSALSAEDCAKLRELFRLPPKKN